MELHQPQIELILNVIEIAAVTSLALICVYLKRDNEKMAAELELRTQVIPNRWR